MARAVQLLFAFAAATRTAGAADTTSVVSLYLPWAGNKNLVASVVGVDDAATTFAYDCPQDVIDRNDCGIPSNQEITQGPSTWAMTYTTSDVSSAYSVAYNCKLDTKEVVANCTKTESSSEANSSRSSITVEATTGYTTAVIPVTVTAGVEKLKGAAATGSSTAGGSKATGSSSHNAAPAATQQAVLAGLAAIVGALAV